MYYIKYKIEVNMYFIKYKKRNPVVVAGFQIG